MSQITDDELGALLARDLGRRVADAPFVDPDEIIHRARRKTFRRNAVVAGTTLIALVVAAAVVLPGVAADRSRDAGLVPAGTVTVSDVPETPAPTPVETEADMAARLSNGLVELLRENAIPFEGSPVMVPREYGNPVGVFGAQVQIGRIPARDGGMGMMVFIQRASAWKSGARHVACAGAGTTLRPFEYNCLETTPLPSGTDVRTHIFRDAAGGYVDVRQPDGDLVTIEAVGTTPHHWPTGVNMGVLRAMASSPLLNP